MYFLVSILWKYFLQSTYSIDSTFDKNGLIIIAQNMRATSMANYILQGKLEIDKTEILAKQNKFA